MDESSDGESAQTSLQYSMKQLNIGPVDDNRAMLTDTAEFLKQLLVNPVFVEYLNAFLSQPGLYPHLFWNRRVTAFEEIALPSGQHSVPAPTTWKFGYMQYTRVPRPAPDFITEDMFIVSLDVMGGVVWVQEERLPLFMASDLFSQYRLCLRLTSYQPPPSPVLPQITDMTRDQPPPEEAIPQAQNSDVLDIEIRKEAVRLASKEVLGDDIVEAVAKRCDAGRHKMGSVRVMGEFVSFLTTTDGLHCWQFWLAADQALSYDLEEKLRRLETLRREGLESSTSPHIPIHTRQYMQLAREGEELESMVRYLKCRMLNNLYHYWLPRYIIHSYVTSKEVICAIAKAKSGVLDATSSTDSWRNPDFLAFNNIYTTSSFPTEDTMFQHCISFDSHKDTVGKQRTSRGKLTRPSSTTPVRASVPHYQTSVMRRTTNTVSNATRLLYGEGRAQLVSSLEVDMTLRNEYLLGKIGDYAADHKEVDMLLLENCVQFWRDVQAYRAFFTSDWFNTEVVRHKAMMMLSVYILPTSKRSIRVSAKTQAAIVAGVNAPNDDLFDQAEEEVLKRLQPIWKLSLKQDLTRMRQAVKREGDKGFEDCHPENALLQKSKNSGNPRRSAFTSEQEPERQLTFSEILQNRMELEYFKAFLNEKDAARDLMCWFDVEAFHMCPRDTKERHLQARKIRFLYMTKDYLFSDHGPASKHDIDELMKAAFYKRSRLVGNRPSSPVLLRVQHIAQNYLESKWVPRYLRTKGYQQRKQRGKSMNTGNFDPNQITAENSNEKKESSDWKVPDELRVQHTRDVSIFRKSLKDPQLAAEFHHYVVVKGRRLEANLMFWKEVQKFKLLFHRRSSKGIVHSKYQAVFNRFMNSAVPPRVQISITEEMASEYANKTGSMIGPYVFREPQDIVFDQLFPEWIVFSGWRAEHLANDPNAPLPYHEIIAERERMDRRAQTLMELQRRDEESKAQSRQAKGPQFVLESERVEKRKTLVDFKLSEYLQQQADKQKQESQERGKEAVAVPPNTETKGHSKPFEAGESRDSGTVAVSAKPKRQKTASKSITLPVVATTQSVTSMQTRPFSGLPVPKMATTVLHLMQSKGMASTGASSPQSHSERSALLPAAPTGISVEALLSSGTLPQSRRARPSTMPTPSKLSGYSVQGGNRRRPKTISTTRSAGLAPSGPARFHWRLLGPNPPPAMAVAPYMITEIDKMLEKQLPQQPMSEHVQIGQLRRKANWEILAATPKLQESFLVTDSKSFDSSVPRAVVRRSNIQVGTTRTAKRALHISLAAMYNPKKPQDKS